MTTPLTITSINQGKIYKDWTLEVAKEMTVTAKQPVIARHAPSVLQSLRSWIKSHGQQLAQAARLPAWHAH